VKGGGGREKKWAETRGGTWWSVLVEREWLKWWMHAGTTVHWVRVSCY